MLWVIIADGEFDQICESLRDAEREKKDLRGMGFDVKVKTVRDWDEAYELEDSLRKGN